MTTATLETLDDVTARLDDSGRLMAVKLADFGWSLTDDDSVALAIISLGDRASRYHAQWDDLKLAAQMHRGER